MTPIQIRKTHPFRPRVRADTTPSSTDHFKEMAEFPLYAVLKVTRIHTRGRGHASETVTATFFPTVLFTLSGSHGPGLRTAHPSFGPSPYSSPAAECFRCGCVWRASGRVAWVRLCIARLFAWCVCVAGVLWCCRNLRWSSNSRDVFHLDMMMMMMTELGGGGTERRKTETRCHFSGHLLICALWRNPSVVNYWRTLLRPAVGVRTV